MYAHTNMHAHCTHHSLSLSLSLPPSHTHTNIYIHILTHTHHTHTHTNISTFTHTHSYTPLTPRVHRPAHTPTAYCHTLTGSEAWLSSHARPHARCLLPHTHRLRGLSF